MSLAQAAPDKNFKLSDQDKILLYSDQNWLKGNSSLPGLACRLEGRYGKGRERFYATASVAAGVAATAVGGFYLAAGRGLISLSAAQSFAALSAVVSVGSVTAVYDQKCKKPILQTSTQASCEVYSHNRVEKFERENCVLDIALEALNIPFPELKGLGVLALGMGMTKSTGQILKTVANPQIEIWSARAAGQIKVAAAKEVEMLNLLKEGKMTLINEAAGGTTGAQFVELGNGVEAVWKPSTSILKLGQREVAAAVVDQHLGTDLVPLTVHRNFNGVDGTLQLRVKNLDPAHFERDPASLAFFDYLIGNRDRNAANSLLTKDGKLVAIDHGSAFQKIPGTPQISILEEDLRNIKMSEKTIRPEEIEFKKARQNQQPWPAQSEQRILRLQKMRTDMKNRTLELAKTITPPQEVVSRLRQTTRQDWETLLGKELSVQQIDDLVMRQKKLLDLIDQSENLFGLRIYSGGPLSTRLSPQR